VPEKGEEPELFLARQIQEGEGAKALRRENPVPLKAD
jgi:hypothetical protein